MLDVLLIATGTVLFAALVLAVAATPAQTGQLTGAALLAAVALGALSLLVPTGSKQRVERDTSTGRIDERA
ncbi:hypothetical protein ACFL5T_04950 [Gemmatimonadota bacterium]